MKSNFLTDDLEDPEPTVENLLKLASSPRRRRSAEELELSVKRCRSEMKASNRRDPLESEPTPWIAVFSVAEDTFDVSIDVILELETSWKDYEGFSKSDVQRIVSEIVENGARSEHDFWGLAQSKAKETYEEAKKALDRRTIELDREKLMASLPDEKHLETIQRYEAHLSRQFYKAMHELQRLQSARMGNQRALPVAVDLDVSIDGEQKPN